MSYKELMKKAAEKVAEASALAEGEEFTPEAFKSLMDEAEALKARAEAMKSASEMKSSIEEPQAPAYLPVEDEEEEEPQAKAVNETPESQQYKAVYVHRHGEISPENAPLVKSIYGDVNYYQLNHEMMADFGAYLRTGKASKSLTRQVWSWDHVSEMLKSGMSPRDIKATMVEGTDILGGYAVPPEVGAQILARTRGLTAVRDGGATVVQTASKSIEWLKVTGGNGRYPTALRGYWGGETKNPPDETNLTFGQKSIPVHVYTYKAPMSVSLLEDASNVVTLFTNAVSTTLAIDEDEAFLIGDGVGKPMGILPGSANGHGLTEVLTGSSGAIAIGGLRLLKRGVASQYRAAGRATLIGNSDTGGDIEGLNDGDTRFYFPDGLNVGERMAHVQATWRESEAMPDVASGSYPLIYGDLSGYAIVERLGLSVQRYNDSNTGINLVEFHVRRRLGGDVIEPWKLAVQKVTS